MKKISPSVTARATIGELFFVLGVFGCIRVLRNRLALGNA